MNRQIVTARSIAKANEKRSFLQDKIRSAQTGTVKETFLNEDLTDREIQIAKSLRNVAKQTQIPDTNFSRDDVEQLLNEDLNQAHVSELKSYRLNVLREEVKKTPTEQKKDEWIDKLIKYIPTEIIAFYLTLTGILGAAANPEKSYVIGVMVVGLVLTFLYLRFFWKVDNYWQITISCIAFLVWAISLDQHLEEIPKLLKALMLPIVTFALPFINPPPAKENKL